MLKEMKRRENGSGTLTAHADGKRIIAVKGKNTKSYSYGRIRTKEEAIKLAEKWLKEKKEESYRKRINSRTDTFDKFYGIWDGLHNVEPHMKKSTTERIRITYRVHIKPVFGNRQLQSISHEELQNFINEKSNELSKSMVDKIMQILKYVFRYSHNCKYIDTNPMLEVKIGKEEYFKVKTKSVLIYSDVDIIKMKKVIDITDAKGKYLFRYGYCFILLAVTGMRLGELVALKWSDVDLVNKSITIKSTAIKTLKDKQLEGEGKYEQIIHIPKTTQSKRDIMLCDEAIQALKILKKSNEDYGIPESEFVLTGDVGQMSDKRTVQKSFERILKRAGLLLSSEEKKTQTKSIHSLRHTFASKLIAEDIPVFVVSKALGHKNIKTTLNMYGHILEKQQSELIEAQNRIFDFSNKEAKVEDKGVAKVIQLNSRV